MALRYRSAASLAVAAVAALLTSCSAPPPTPVVMVPLPEPVQVAPAAPVEPTAAMTPPPAPTVVLPAGKISRASTPMDYRRDAAGHLYSLNAHRIYAGQLPPLLYAIGVLQVEVDRQGQVVGTSWMRAPRHAPEVMAEIERTVRQAAPFPAPARMGRVTYTDTWLWDRSGRFQLDTLTQGQR